jgi:hypothetical protein
MPRGDEAIAQRPEGIRVVEWRGDVGRRSRERLPASVVQPVAGELLDPAAGPLAKAASSRRLPPEPPVA